jgi:DNA (cytosine-5)-methyltransferase 1
MTNKRPMVPRAEDVPTLKVRQVAGFLGIGVSTAYTAVTAGEIPSIRLGGRVVVPTAALRRMLGLDAGEGDVTATDIDLTDHKLTLLGEVTPMRYEALTDRPTKAGSLCTGYTGLEMGVALAGVGLDVRWHAENDPHASKVLAHRYPAVPNLGDLTAVDWTRVEPVDLICFGFPCTDLSYAGRGAGIIEGNASGLFFACWNAVRVLRPALVFMENVAAVVVRRPGLDVVLDRVAQDGYDARWLCLPACDVGAPHRRDRWFCVAADTGGQRFEGWTQSDSEPVGPGLGASRRVDVDRLGGAFADSSDCRVLAADHHSEGLQGAQPAPGCRVSAWSGRSAVPDADGTGLSRGVHEPHQGRTRPGQRGPAPATDPEGCGVSHEKGRGDPEGFAVVSIDRAGDRDRPGHAAPGVREQGEAAAVVAWGPYEPAIRRWEQLTRPAPDPTDTRGRLNPAFVEWMQGLPAGWVTDVGIPRTAQLRALGNGVVPHQCAAAWRMLQALERAG